MSLGAGRQPVPIYLADLVSVGDYAAVEFRFYNMCFVFLIFSVSLPVTSLLEAWRTRHFSKDLALPFFLFVDFWARRHFCTWWQQQPSCPGNFQRAAVALTFAPSKSSSRLVTPLVRTFSLEMCGINSHRDRTAYAGPVASSGDQLPVLWSRDHRCRVHPSLSYRRRPPFQGIRRLLFPHYGVCHLRFPVSHHVL